MPKHNRPLASILTRRLAWITIAVVIVNAIAVALYYGSDRQALENEAIEHQIRNLEASISGEPLHIDERARALFENYPDHYGFALLHRDGRLLDSENKALIPVQALQAGLFAQNWLTRVQQPEGSLLVASQKIASQDDRLQLVFVMAGDPAGLLRKALIAEFVTHIWLPILPIALILIGTNAFLIRRGIKPVATAAQWARSIKPGMPTPPLTDRRFPTEVMDLVDATQRSLERLNVALTAEKRRAAEAAHALRTPVAVLIARVDALPPGETTDRLRTDLAALSRTVRQLLASAGADGLNVTDTSRADLCRVATSVTAALAPIAYQHGAELSLNLKSTSVIARADSNAVELALSNLVENAIFHAGKVAVIITVGPETKISVRDYGPGFPPGAGANIFEAFWRGENAAPGGAGLGLAIVERLQRAQGGSVEANNIEGGGAEFLLTYLPD